jgi:hypothetical protein
MNVERVTGPYLQPFSNSEGKDDLTLAGKASLHGKRILRQEPIDDAVSVFRATRVGSEAHATQSLNDAKLKMRKRSDDRFVLGIAKGLR